jgi:hypothetical protein
MLLLVFARVDHPLTGNSLWALSRACSYCDSFVACVSINIYNHASASLPRVFRPVISNQRVYVLAMSESEGDQLHDRILEWLALAVCGPGWIASPTAHFACRITGRELDLQLVASTAYLG